MFLELVNLSSLFKSNSLNCLKLPEDFPGETDAMSVYETDWSEPQGAKIFDTFKCDDTSIFKASKHTVWTNMKPLNL